MEIGGMLYVYVYVIAQVGVKFVPEIS